MNNCHGALTWLANNSPRPVESPTTRIMSLGPYLSEDQPPRIEKMEPSAIYVEKMPEVAARLSRNSPSIGLKKTPKDMRIPKVIMPIRKKLTTMSHP